MGLLRNLRKAIHKKRSRTVETVPTVPNNKFPEVKPKASSKDLLSDWSKTLDMVEKHPLSQARVINTAILGDLTTVLSNMNDRLNALSKLDEIIRLLTEAKSSISSSPAGLTLKDSEAVNVLRGNDFMTTEDFAEKAGLSRSTASSRLNKLFSLGLLDKVADGKKISYKIKQ